MRRPIVVALAVLSVPVVLAAAGGWATITIHDLPEAAVTGEPMALEFSLRQHGAEPLPGMRPVLTARSGSETVRVQALPGSRAGTYAAALTVPSAGEWSVHVSAGFRDAEVTLLPITAHAPGARVAPQSLPVRGRHLFVAKGCLTCHTHAAVPGSGVVDIAPALTARTYDAALAEAGVPARVTAVIEDKKRGLVARLEKAAPVDDAAVASILGQFNTPWEWAA